MNNVSQRRVPESSPVLEEALRRRQEYYASKTSGSKFLFLMWACTVSLADANYSFLLKLFFSKPASLLVKIVYLVEMFVFVACLTSLLFLVWRWLYPLYSSPLYLSDQQFRLLKLSPDTPGFARSPVKELKYPNPFTPLPGSLISSQTAPSPTTSTTPVNTSFNSWLSSSSPLAGGGSNSPGSPVSGGSSLNTSNLRRDHYSGYESPITDELQLSDYLNDYSAWESSYLSDKAEDSGSVASQSMLYWRSGSKPDASQLRRSVYQLSSPPSKTSSSSTDSPTDKAQTEVLSQRLGVDPMRLVKWNENLRIWITQTILKPLVSEIDMVNSSLPKQGVSDCKIGESPLDRLRKVCGLPQIAANLPTLSSLLPFLEVCQDQEYLASRLKDLSSTGALSQYRWNSGGPCRGQAWTDKLPTDSELILHMLAAYLDSRLVASSSTRLSDSMESMPFTHSHFFKFGEKIENCEKDILAIVQIKARPPHYVVQIGDKQLDVGGGRNNLLHTLLLFLHQVREERGGMLGQVNLGLSGLNVLWVLD